MERKRFKIPIVDRYLLNRYGGFNYWLISITDKDLFILDTAKGDDGLKLGKLTAETMDKCELSFIVENVVLYGDPTEEDDKSKKLLESIMYSTTPLATYSYVDFKERTGCSMTECSYTHIFKVAHMCLGNPQYVAIVKINEKIAIKSKVH